MKGMEFVGVRLPRGIIAGMNEMIKSGIYTNKSELIREATRKAFSDWARAEMGKHLPKDFDSVKWVHEQRKKDLKEAMKETGGDKDKAYDLIYDRANKIAERMLARIGQKLED